MGIFKFSSHKVQSFFQYDLKVFRQLKQSLDFIFPMMEEIGHSITLTSLNKVNLNKVKKNKGKNYDWIVVNYLKHQFLIRVYKQHLTIYCKVDDEYGKKIGVFTYHSNLEGMDDWDKYFDNPFTDFNKSIKVLLPTIIEHGVQCVDNSVTCPVPKHVEIKVAFDENTIFSYDQTIFSLEEIEGIHLKLFAENKMVERLKEIKHWVGREFYCKGEGNYTIKKVDSKVKDNYYHYTGISLINEDGKTKFEDVYSLSRWYFDEVFKQDE